MTLAPILRLLDRAADLAAVAAIILLGMAACGYASLIEFAQ
jgi:hypothetical protein